MIRQIDRLRYGGMGDETTTEHLTVGLPGAASPAPPGSPEGASIVPFTKGPGIVERSDGLVEVEGESFLSKYGLYLLGAGVLVFGGILLSRRKKAS